MRRISLCFILICYFIEVDFLLNSYLIIYGNTLFQKRACYNVCAPIIWVRTIDKTSNGDLPVLFVVMEFRITDSLLTNKVYVG